MNEVFTFDVDGWDQEKIKKLQEVLKEKDPEALIRTSVVVQCVDSSKRADILLAGLQEGASCATIS